jgi:hypothetical protein
VEEGGRLRSTPHRIDGWRAAIAVDLARIFNDLRRTGRREDRPQAPGTHWTRARTPWGRAAPRPGAGIKAKGTGGRAERGGHGHRRRGR